MKKIIMFLLFLIFLIILNLNGKVFYTFKNLTNPSQLIVLRGKIYIIQNATLYSYCEKTGQLIFKFGKKGQGPGEFNINPSLDMKLRAVLEEKYIFLFDTNKFCKVNYQGKLMSEKRTPFYILNMQLIGKNYIVKKYEQKGKTHLCSITLIKEDLQLVRVLGTDTFDYTPGIFKPVTDYLDFRTSGENSYLLQGRKDISLTIFDNEGNRINNFSIETKTVLMTEKHKNLALEYLNEKSWYRMIPTEYKKKIVYPEFLPACKNFLIADKKIYIHSFYKENKKTEFLIISITDNFVKSVFIPVVDMNLLEFTPYSINNNKFYYLKENDEDQWEIHQEEFFPVYIKELK